MRACEERKTKGGDIAPSQVVARSSWLLRPRHFLLLATLLAVALSSQVARVVVKSAPSLPRKQIKTAFRTAVNLTFTTGFERSANKLDAGRFEADARLFAECVIGGLYGDAAAKASA